MQARRAPAPAPNGRHRGPPAGASRARARAHCALDRIGQHGRQQRGLVAGEIAGRLAKGVAAAGLDAEFAVRAPFGDIEVDFQNPPLRQHQVDPERQRKLQRLAQPAAARPQEQVLRHLLGDGGTAAHVLEVVGIGHGIADFREVDAVMAAKAAVLGDDHGERERRRDARQRHILPLHALAADAAPEHHGGDRLAEAIERRDQVGQQQQDQQREADCAQRPRQPQDFGGEARSFLRPLHHDARLAHPGRQLPTGAALGLTMQPWTPLPPISPIGSPPSPPKSRPCSTACWP